MTRFAIALLLILPLTPAPQSPQDLPAFEVASVKRNPNDAPPGDNPHNMDPSPGHFGMRDVPLRFAVEWAWDLKDYQVEGPDWIKFDERFDIEARAAGPATDNQMRPMLQRLLIERLHMKVHHETRDLAIYALIRGKGELKLKPAAAGEPPHLAGNGTAVEFHNFPLSRLTFLLTRRMDRPAIDLTGIDGNFDYAVDISGLGNHPGSTGEDGSGPSIFSAVQSDLGLKLDPRKHPVDVLVIDSVSKVPVEN